MGETVFVLGAGASAPFQYPLGKKLVDDILAFNVDNDSGMNQKVFKDFTAALRRSGVNSVDLFLEHNPHFLDIGRMAIANILIRQEAPVRLWADTFGPRHEPLDNWYKYLFNKLVERVTFEQVDKWPISFITFNYDRSLEYFLFEAVKSLYNKNDEEVAYAFRDIEFIHLHGHLGLLPWQKGEHKRPYDGTRTPEKIDLAAKQIRIVHEATPDTPEFNRAHQKLTNASHIYVLGFGYHPMNVTRLRLVEGGTSVSPHGTACGLTPEEKAAINKRGCNVSFPMVAEFGIVPFLRHNERFLNTKWGDY